MSEGQDKLSGLRDTRKPCHFWVDNEVADCYQPIVGADAIWVYCRIARNAHGAWIVSPKRRDGDTRVSLREMADWCGKSVDTVWRCLQVLEHVGLLRAMRGAKSSGRYALADVKDLVTGEGAVYDRETGSFQLPPARVAELKQQVKELRAKLARKAAAGVQLAVVGGRKSVAQSDRLEEPLFSAADEKCDRSVAPDVQICRSGSTDINLLEESKTTRKTTLRARDPELVHPARADGEFTAAQQEHLDRLAAEGRETKWVEGWRAFYLAENATAREALEAEAAKERGLRSEYPDLKTALRKVRLQCGFAGASGDELGMVLEQVFRDQAEMGKPLWRVAPQMIAAWLLQRQQGKRLRARYGPVKFYRDGHWLDPQGWHWDTAQLAHEVGAKVGS